MRYIAVQAGTCLVAPACVASLADETPQPDLLTTALVSGDDDRLDYFNLGEARSREAGQFTVALIRAFHAEALEEGRISSLPTWGELDHLCPDEPFADQPTAAFCSGVLAEPDLILTAGHCIGLIPLENIRAIFGYYYTDRDELTVQADDIYAISEVVAASDPSQDPKLDFAWLRLSHAVDPARRPASLYVRGPAVARGDAILTVGAAGGTPLKWDSGGSVFDVRDSEGGYFVADTDTFRGSSGSPAFDSEMNVIGISVRGAPDFASSDQGCRTTIRRDPAVEEPNEQFMYVHHAVTALCKATPESPLCASDCRDPCRVLLSATPPAPTDAGCSITRRSPSDQRLEATLALLLGMMLRARFGRERSA